MCKCLVDSLFYIPFKVDSPSKQFHRSNQVKYLHEGLKKCSFVCFFKPFEISKRWTLFRRPVITFSTYMCFTFLSVLHDATWASFV